MRKSTYLASLSAIGIAGGLMAAPASASGTPDVASEEVSLEVQGIFQGFRLIQSDLNVEVPDMSMLPDFSVQRSVAASQFAPTPEIIVRDDVGLDGSVDVDNTQPAVVQLFLNSSAGLSFNCTGSVINPRTILTAAHCLNFNSSEDYGKLGEAPINVVVSSGVDSGIRLGNGPGYNSFGGAAISTDVIIHPSANLDDGGLPFPWADVALVAVDEPITDVGTLPILFSPLTELTHVIQVGYGGFGTAATGDDGIGTLRRIGENMLGAQASVTDLLDTVAPFFVDEFGGSAFIGAETQVFHFTDFDNPDRTPEQQAACAIIDGGLTCGTDDVSVFDAARAVDYFDGDALPNEVATAGGDSGSPLIADELGVPGGVITAVLSGGFDFFNVGNTFGDISFYTPLFPFFEFITENTPYKYVSAQQRGGNWSDPTIWTQDLDPGFLIDDGSGNLINGIPDGEERGVFETGPKLGTILGEDISDNDPDIQSVALPPEGTPNFGSEIPESSVLLGPGSTGFVPNNTDGTPGVSFEDPAQYFDVILNRRGTVTADIDVEIDRLTLDNNNATFVLPGARTFSTVIGYEQLSGIGRINGQLTAPTVGVFGGLLEGTGVITSDVVFNLGGFVSPGGSGSERRTGTLTIDGDFVNTSAGIYIATVQTLNGGGLRSDLLSVTGGAGLDGLLAVVTRGRRVRSGDEFTVLSADFVVGEFADTFLFGQNTATLFATSRVEGGDVIVEIEARRLEDMFAETANLSSVGASLDTLRATQFDSFVGLFDIIDGASVNTLASTLASLTPVSAFGQSRVATNFSQRFTGQIAQRTLALRGGNQAANTFSAAGAGQVASIAQAGGGDVGKLGFFGTVSGQYLVTAEERNKGTNALEESAFMQAGEMTLGADLRMSEDLTVGFAMTSIQNSASQLGFRQRADDTSLSGAIYAALQKGNAFSDVYLGFSRQNFGVERASQGEFAFAFDTASGEAEGRQQFGGVRVGYAFDLAPGVEVGPVASVDYVRSDLGGFSELGAGQFGLTVLDRTFTSVGAKAGLMGSLETAVGRKGRLSAFGSVAYAQELGDTQDAVVAALTNARDLPFTIVNQLDPNWISASAGVDFAVGSRFSVGVSGQSDMGRGVLTNNQGRVNLNWKF